jgi:hypothetical protein
MRSLLLLMFTFSLIIIPFTSHAKKAKTIDELVAMYDSQKCGKCHYDIHENWSKSWHSKSIIDPRTIRTFRTFLLSGVDKLPEVKRAILRDMCLICHVPVATAASDELAEEISGLIITAVDDKDASKRESAKKELSKLNINCLTCHGMDIAGPGGKFTPDTIYGPGDAKNPPHKDVFGFNTVKSENMKKAEFCKACHHGCPPEMSSKECPTQWTVYQEHYLAQGGKKTCQDCHMRGEGVKTHRFPGVYETDFAKSALELKLDVTPTRYFYHLKNEKVPAVVLNVQLKNVGAHDVPHG